MKKILGIIFIFTIFLIFPSISVYGEEKEISGVQYFRQCVNKAKPAANVETETPEAETEANAETETAIDPAARLAKDAANFFDYGIKHGFDFATLRAMLDAAAVAAGEGNAAAATA